jgi:hypothetical protein
MIAFRFTFSPDREPTTWENERSMLADLANHPRSSQEHAAFERRVAVQRERPELAGHTCRFGALAIERASDRCAGAAAGVPEAADLLAADAASAGACIPMRMP